MELFILEAPKVEEHLPLQDKLWQTAGALQDERLGQLVDRINSKIGSDQVRRFLPDEHYWPERSFVSTSNLAQKSLCTWRLDKPRPVQLLPKPEKIMVTAPIPDYPPMLFRYNGKLHKIIRADGPERIEQEWWIQDGEHRDYYSVEDENGNRYWLFRLGHYAEDKNTEWFLHGFFA
jgi:protein ImuB